MHFVEQTPEKWIAQLRPWSPLEVTQSTQPTVTEVQTQTPIQIKPPSRPFSDDAEFKLICTYSGTNAGKYLKVSTDMTVFAGGCSETRPQDTEYYCGG